MKKSSKRAVIDLTTLAVFAVCAANPYTNGFRKTGELLATLAFLDAAVGIPVYSKTRRAEAAPPSVA